MKSAVFVLSSLIVVSLVSELAAAGSESRRPEFVARSAPSCTAQAPAEAQAGAPAQFGGSVDVGVAGSDYSNDPYIYGLNYVPPTGPAGFTQGSPSSEIGRQSRETQFTHRLTRHLAVMNCEVSRLVWANLAAVRPDLPPDPSDQGTSPTIDHPVQQVTWQEAVLFANLLSIENGRTRCYYTDGSKTTPITPLNYADGNYYCDFSANGYRLPTEGEWEYFCRAGTATPFWISEPDYDTHPYDCSPASILPILQNAAWFCVNGGGVAHEYYTKSPNPWSLRGVHGNVFEWCWDWIGIYPAGSVTDYTGAAPEFGRVARGGAWNSTAAYVRSASRANDSPAGRAADLGFRLVHTIPIAYEWDFGDGSAHSTEQNPTHTYDAPGTYAWTMTCVVDGAPCVRSGFVTVQAGCVPPLITQHPQDQTIASGQSATLTTQASGTSVSYTWYQGQSGDTSIPVEVNAGTLVTAPLTTTTSFWALAGNGCGTAASNAATVTVTGGGSGPTISKITSKTSKPGSAATIYGSGFSANRKDDIVYFGTKKAAVKSAKPGSLKVTIPRVKKGVVAVCVAVKGVKSGVFLFTVK